MQIYNFSKTKVDTQWLNVQDITFPDDVQLASQEKTLTDSMC